MTYQIIRTYRNGQPSRTIKTGLEMAEVQEYFNKPQDPQTEWEMQCEWEDTFKFEGDNENS